jgi:hypothetical protein
VVAIGAIAAEGQDTALGFGEGYGRRADTAFPVAAAIGEYASGLHGMPPGKELSRGD